MEVVVGDSSSPFSPESNFRELDDVYLQTQARIWLGEVLQTRFHENVNMSELLADGELLFEVSGIVWRMLLTRYKELRHIEAFKYEPFASRKSSRSYMPYSNVDSFLKICKIMGLAGIDLFSPSDVVEKKNTRKVCMCIRSLSKKARSKQLNVPDFDMVTYMVAMPTDNVGCLRRSLEQSQQSFSGNASLNAEQVLMGNLNKINSIAAYYGKFHTCSEEPIDHSDCNFMIQPDGSSITCSHGASSQINSNLIDSPGVSSVVEKHAPAPQFSPSENHAHQFESLFFNESSGSCSFLLGEHDYQQDSFSSPSCVDSLIHLSLSTSPTKTVRHSYESGALHFHELELTNDILEGSLGGSTQDRNDVTNQFSVSDMIFEETGIINPIQFDGNDSCFRECRSPSSHGSNSTPRTNGNGFKSKLYDIDDVELSSAVLNLDFEDQLDAGYDIKVVSSPEFQGYRAHLINNESQNIFKYMALMHHPTSITDKPPIGMDIINAGLSTKPFLPCADSQSWTTNNSDYDVLYDERTSRSGDSKVEYDKWSPTESNSFKGIHCDQCLELLSGQSSSLFEIYPWDQKGKCAVHTITNENYGNNGHGIYPHYVSQGGLHVENASYDPAKPTADLLVRDIKSDVTKSDKVVPNAAMFELGHPYSHFQSKLSEEDCASQDWDRMIQHISHQNRHILLTASEDHPLGLQDAVCPPTTNEKIIYKDSCSSNDCPESLGCQSSQVSVDDKNDSYHAKNGFDMQSQNNEKQEEGETLAAENSDTTETPNAAEHKPYGRLLLKSVVRGTVVFGALFLFLQLRKSSREEAGESNMQLGKKVVEENGVKISRQKQHKESKVDGVYPGNKLGFGG